MSLKEQAKEEALIYTYVFHFASNHSGFQIHLSRFFEGLDVEIMNFELSTLAALFYRSYSFKILGSCSFLYCLLIDSGS